jgi:AcrR family transcriptional regulator
MALPHSVGAADEETPRPLRKDAARNRAALITAARAVFAERGLDASMDDVARAAGVGVGTAYRHFANKYELAAAIFTEVVDEIVGEAHRAASMTDAWSGLMSFLEAVATRQSADRGLRDVLMGVRLGKVQDDEINERLTGQLRIMVARAKQQGSIRPDADVTDVGVLLVMLCTVADLSGDVAPDLWRRYQPMLLAGLRPGGPVLPIPPLDEDTLHAAIQGYKGCYKGHVRPAE